MSLIDLLADKGCWEKFYEYKLSLCCDKAFTAQLRGFIDNEQYLPVYRRILSGKAFPLPEKSEVSKLGKEKKRVVYTYPYAENITLKLLTYLCLRKYDYLFCRGLYSFRPGRNAKDAVKMLRGKREISHLYAYKADISNYFNSVPIKKLIPMIQQTLLDDERLCEFIISLLSEEQVKYRGSLITEQKGIMAGTPISAFLANLYLKDLDKEFEDNGALYVRYSDDLLIFAKSDEQINEYRALIKAHLDKMGLVINSDKEQLFKPNEGWSFLGFHFCGGIIDIAPVTYTKLKNKMRRKARSLIRWADRNEVQRERAAAAFIRVFNKKLFETSGGDNELSWSLWFFPVINTDKTLKRIDNYAQECLRYIISGKRTKARFNVRYQTLKDLGYKSLVNEYYRLKATPLGHRH